MIWLKLDMKKLAGFFYAGHSDCNSQIEAILTLATLALMYCA